MILLPSLNILRSVTKVNIGFHPLYSSIETSAAAAAVATKGTMGCGVVSMDLFPTYHSHHRFSMLIPHLALSQRAKKNDIIWP